MNILAPVSTIMTKDLITVNPEDKLQVVKEIFDNNLIHHIPVVRYRKIVGIISKTDLLSFLKGASNFQKDGSYMNGMRLRNYLAEDIMTSGLAKVESSDRIDVVLEVFKENLFHAVPVVDNDELIGIVTTYDIITELSKSTAAKSAS